MNWVIINNEVVNLKDFLFTSKDRFSHFKNIIPECKINVDLTDLNIKLIDSLFTNSVRSNIFFVKSESCYWVINGSIKIFTHTESLIKLEIQVNHFDIKNDIPDECLTIIINQKIQNLLNANNNME